MQGFLAQIIQGETALFCGVSLLEIDRLRLR